MVKTPKQKIVNYYGHGLLAEPDFSMPFFGRELLRYGGIDHIRRFEERLISEDELRSVLSIQDYPQLPDWFLALAPTDEQDAWVRVSVNHLSKDGYKMARVLNFGRGIFYNVRSRTDSLCLISLLRKEYAGLGVKVDGLAHPYMLLDREKDDLARYGAEMNRIIRAEIGLLPETVEGARSMPESDHNPGRRK